MFNKLYTAILDSSVWLESDPTRIVWVTFLASMDEDGFCRYAAVENVAHRARVSLHAARHAIDVLEAPDQNSSNPENEGRRIERVPGGWMVLNSKHYRGLITREVQREQTRIRVAAHRAKKKGVTLGNGGVTESNGGPASVTESELEGGARGDKIEPPPGFPRSEEEALAMAGCIPPGFVRMKYDEAVGVGFKNWNGKNIHSFAHWIKGEFERDQQRKRDGKTNRGNNPRNAGVSQNNEVNNYAKLAKRKLERQMAEAKNRESPKVEGTGS